MSKEALPFGYLLLQDVELLMYGLWSISAKEGVFVEIGSYLGLSSILIGGFAKEQKGKLYCIDVWDSFNSNYGICQRLDAGKKRPPEKMVPYQQFLGNMHRWGLDDVVVPMKMRSDEAFRTWSLPIKFIFIDGCHEYSFVKADALWKKFVVAGGVMVFHDYVGRRPELVRAVNEVMLTDPGFKKIALGNLCIVFQRA